MVTKEVSNGSCSGSVSARYVFGETKGDTSYDHFFKVYVFHFLVTVLRHSHVDGGLGYSSFVNRTL